MKHILYKTTCIITGHFYFGIHSSEHEDQWYLGSGRNLKALIAIHGKQNFIRETLNEFETRSAAEEAETLIIQEHWKLPLSLNIRTSSKGWFKDRSKEERSAIGKKISAGMKKSSKVPRGNSAFQHISREDKGKYAKLGSSRKNSIESEKARAKWINILNDIDWDYVDVTKYGWVQRLSDLIHLSPQKVRDVVSRYKPEILINAYARNRAQVL